MSFFIRTIDSSCIFHDSQVIESLTEVLCYGEPEMMESTKQFWNDWLLNNIPGEKLTIVAQETDKDSNQKFIGVVRFWKTPYCNNKWLVEGLEVVSPKRRNGIGRDIVEYGIGILKVNGAEEVIILNVLLIGV